MKLILFGGIQGVGKTTLLSRLQRVSARHIVLINPGELFRQYFYREKLKTTDEIEELIVRKIETLSKDSIALIHWHYAVPRPSGFIPQISFSRLEQIAKGGKVDNVILLLVEAPADAVRKRRIKDRKSKKRATSLSAIRKELAVEKKYLAKHHTLFSRALGARRATIYRLPNINLPDATMLLKRFFKSRLGIPQKRN